MEQILNIFNQINVGNQSNPSLFHCLLVQKLHKDIIYNYKGMQF